MNKAHSIIIISTLLASSLQAMYKEEPKLHQAVKAKNWALIQELLEEPDLPIDERDDDGNTALHIAVQLSQSNQETENAFVGPETIVKALLAKGASTKACNKAKKTPAEYVTNITIMNLLLLNCASPRTQRHTSQEEAPSVQSRENVTQSTDASTSQRPSLLKRLNPFTKKHSHE